MMNRKRYKATTTKFKDHAQIYKKICHKYTTIESQEALGDSFGTTSAPRGLQDRKRHERLGSLAAPRGPQRNAKIIILVSKPEHKVEKVASRMHLAKVIHVERNFFILVPFVKPWGSYKW